MRKTLRLMLVVIMVLLIVPFLADLHRPFGSASSGVAYAKGGGGSGDGGGSGSGGGRCGGCRRERERRSGGSGTAAPAVPVAATAVAAEGTPAAAAVTPPEVATAVGIAVKTPLRHSAIATGIATEIKTAIKTVTGIGDTRRTARMAWVTAIAVEAWGSPCRTLRIKHRRRRARAAHRSDRRYATPCIRHRSRRGSSARPKRGPGRNGGGKPRPQPEPQYHAIPVAGDHRV